MAIFDPIFALKSEDGRDFIADGGDFSEDGVHLPPFLPEERSNLSPSRPEKRSHLRSSVPKNGLKIGPKKKGRDFFENTRGLFRRWEGGFFDLPAPKNEDGRYFFENGGNFFEGGAHLPPPRPEECKPPSTFSARRAKNPPSPSSSSHPSPTNPRQSAQGPSSDRCSSSKIGPKIEIGPLLFWANRSVGVPSCLASPPWSPAVRRRSAPTCPRYIQVWDSSVHESMFGMLHRAQYASMNHITGHALHQNSLTKTNRRLHTGQQPRHFSPSAEQQLVNCGLCFPVGLHRSFFVHPKKHSEQLCSITWERHGEQIRRRPVLPRFVTTRCPAMRCPDPIRP